MIDLGLQRISRLLAQTPLPWRAIHVAGTNGKGSVCAYVSGMLEAYNNSAWREKQKHTKLKHARFTSPHLVDRWDCISINQMTVPFSVFSEVEKRVLERNTRESIGATPFELLTATAFEIFTKEEVDVGVIEVGMGGRLDATNVIGQPVEGAEDHARPLPLVTVITSIGLDHQTFLGNTLEEIAEQKAGIIKPGVPVLCDWTNDAKVIEVVERTAKENDSRFSASWSVMDDLSSSTFEKAQRHLPQHVQHNLSLAYLATEKSLEQLNRYDERTVSRYLEAAELKDAMYQVGCTIAFPGRQQHLSMKKLTGRHEDVILDGAHNAQSAVALASYISMLRRRARGAGSPNSFDNSTTTWVVAASDSKDVKAILSPLLEVGDSVIAVEFRPVDGMPWVKPMPASQLLEAANAIRPLRASLQTFDCGSDILAALKQATELSAEGPMVIVGSLYLASDVLRLLRDAEG